MCMGTIPYYANIWLEPRTQKQWLTDYERMGFFEISLEHISFRQLLSKCSSRKR